jgi:hypothetical protein
LTRLRAARFVIANSVHSERWAKRSSVMSKVSKASASKASDLNTSNVLLIEVPPQFIALCRTTGVTAQAALRGLAAMVCGLRYDEHNRLVPLEDDDVRSNA